ncbi:hypothetical protein BX600DRAFT_434199 [Xylariales sp. PMI_506]|nr:hypothetical protein BX600DRAFT_434199 [Xylariales sp. PMI_506]
MSAKTKVNPLNGMHTAGIYSDMSIDGPVIGTLVVIIDRAKNLPNRKTIGKQDPYCAARLGKEAKKTTTDIRGGQTPRWDQELRFTVHDSPDYYQLKLSVFNDDKKTELIGETWIDLRDIVLPGGGQVDQWQNLNCRGKYAGEIRMEITYYDSRPKPEKQAAKPKPVASGPEQEPGVGAQRTPVKRRPLPTNPGSTESPSAPAPPAQTPSRPQPNVPMPAFIPKQSPLQALEYNTPPPGGYHPSDQDPATPDHGGRFATSPAQWDEHQYSASVDRNDKFIAYEEDGQYNPDQYSRSYGSEPRTPNHSAQPTYRSPSPLPQPSRQPEEIDECPPPPPAHRVRNSSGNIYEVSPHHKTTATMPMRHDVLRSEAHRQSLQNASSPSTVMSNYPGRPVYRPHDSAPDMITQSPYENQNQNAGPRHYSYDSGFDAHHRSMQPTVEDVPESWTPPSVRSQQASARQEQHADMGYGSVPSPAPLNLSGRNSTNLNHYSPSPVQSHKHYGSNHYTASPSPISSRDEAREYVGNAYTDSYASGSELYQPSDMTTSQSYGYGSSSYMLPPVPPTLVPGVDPSLSQEIAHRFHEDRKHERRYTQSGPAVTPTRGRQYSEPPDHYDTHLVSYKSNPSLTGVYDSRAITYPGNSGMQAGQAPIPEPRRHSASPNPSHTIRRKSVSPAPPPSERRLSAVPFGPDSYDELNPSVISAKEESKNGEYTNAYGKIITSDGREVDPSDHLPMDTWAPEPEPKQPKPKPESNSRPTPGGAQPMPPSGRRQIRITARPQSMAVVPATHSSSSVDLSPPSTGRNRLQKKSHRMSALPAPVPSSSGPLGPATAHQRNSTPPRALIQATAYDYENHGPPYGSPGTARGPQSNGPPIPAKIPIMSGALVHVSGGYGATGDRALIEEMSRIDIGTGRARRHGGY